MIELPSIVIAIWGAEKTWKSSMALSFPKPLYHFDLDVGGFARAVWRLSPEDIAAITSKSFPTPLQLEKLLGAQKDKVTLRFPRKIIGIKEVWQKFVLDFVDAVQKPEIKTIVIDSGTQLWSIAHQGYLQELQERQLAVSPGLDENKLREKLLPVEYGEPNSRMRSIIYSARSHTKHLVITHYPRDVYAQRVGQQGIEEYKTGEIEPDGFKDTQKLVDIVVVTEQSRNGEVFAKITRCGLPGLGTKATGLTLPEPSYKGIMDLAKAMSGS